MALRGLLGGALVAASLGLSGCLTVSPEEAGHSFSSNLRADGPNPLLRNQAMRDLEDKLRNYVLQPTPNTQMDYLIDVVAPQLGSAAFRSAVRELDQGAVVIVVDRFGRQPSGAGPCVVEPTRATPYLRSDETSPSAEPIVWQFVAGDCVDGKANGLASARSQDGTKTFTGRFANGGAVEGVYQDFARSVLRVGPLGEPNERVRAAYRFEPGTGKTPVYYVGDMVDGHSDGYGAFGHYYDTGLEMISAGHHRNGRLAGPGAKRNIMNFLNGGRKWGAWIGTWQDGKAHGLAGWTNDAEMLLVGTYENGTLRGIAGSYWSGLEDPANLDRLFRFGGYENGERNGQHVVMNAWSGDETQQSWNHGTFVGDDSFNIGQLLAMAGGAAIIGMADIPDAAKLQLGGAYAADVMTNGNGSTTMATAAAISTGMASTGPDISSPTTPVAQAAARGDVRHESYTFTCDHGGTHTIDVPYLDIARVPYKKAYAKTMACNEIDNMASVIGDCERVFGNKMCVEQ